MTLRPVHVIAALAAALAIDAGLVLLLSRTTPDPHAPPHLEVVEVPFVPEPPPPAPPEVSAEASAAAPAQAAIEPAPPSPVATPGAPRIPVQAGLPGGSIRPGALAGLSGSEPRAEQPQAQEVKDASAVDSPPRALARRMPRYPAEAEGRGLSGVVVLRLRIDTEGRVAEANVVRASPPGVFDAAAVSAVKTWRFTPARDAGRPVEVWAQQALRFDLP